MAAKPARIPMTGARCLGIGLGLGVGGFRFQEREGSTDARQGS